MSKIYTKTGDRGRTGTFRGRMAKSDELAETLGAVDELNSWIGLCRAKLTIDNGQLTVEMKRIQKDLLVIGSGLAGSGVKISGTETKRLERLIDKLTKDLPKLANFIYPTGELQVARAVCRKAERRVVSYRLSVVGEGKKFDENILKYLNRLSDALFTMGRWVNRKQGGVEEVWRGR